MFAMRGGGDNCESMAQPVEQRRMTVEEFLSFERSAPNKHQYIAGDVFAMTGASPRHNAIVANLVMLVGQQLGNSCRVFPSDLKIYVPAFDAFTYPDATVICGELTFYQGTTDVVTNPTILFEVLSESTERYDRGEKAEGYRTIASVTDHVLVGQHREHIEHYWRQGDGAWVLRETGAGGAIEIRSAGISLLADEIYSRVFELPA